MNSKLLCLCLALGSALLAGCASYNNIRKSDSEIHETAAKADRAIQRMRAASEGGASNNIHYDTQYVDLTPMPITRASQLPAKCNDFTFSPPPEKGLDLLQVSELITKLCGIQVRVTPDAMAAAGLGPSATRATANGANGGGATLPPGVGLPPGQGPGATTYGVGGMYGADTPSPLLFDTRYQGSLAGFLDTEAARFGVSWRVSHHTIVMFQNETRIFKIYNLPRAIDTFTTLTSGTVTTTGVSQGGQGGGATSSGSEGGGGSTGTMQSTRLSLKDDPALDLVNSVAAMATPGSPKPVYAPSNNTLVVNDTPDVLDRVKLYVDDLNATYSKQVLISVDVLAVTLDTTDSYGINWSAVYKDAANKFGVTLSNAYTATNGAVQGSINILSGNKQWSGSQALAEALATQGNVRVVTTTSVLARNLKPTPVQIADSQGYVYSANNTISGGTGGFAEAGAQPGSITTGFHMEALPDIYPDNKTIELALNINISDLIAIVKKQVGNTALETPNFTTKSFAPDVQMQSGQTAVIASFKQGSADNERSGVGSPLNWLFGGGITGKRKQVYVVIMATPIIRSEKVPVSVVNADYAGD